MPVRTTTYKILLSCPSDVDDLKSSIETCISQFNRTFGDMNNTKLELQHWSTHSYPKSGGKPQDLLNKMFINDCDACIALLGNRFGTPTEKWDSGTEEEIEDMIESGKQVFMYFIERPVDPNKIDLEQLVKVRAFREKYTDKGIYSVIKSDEDFTKELTNHISLYFLKEITDNSNSQEIPRYAPKLNVFAENSTLFNSNFLNNEFKDRLIEKIIAQIEKIKNIKLPETKVKIDETKEDANPLSLQYNIQPLQNINLSSMYPPVTVSNDKKTIISKFASDFTIELLDNFWDLGNLTRSNFNLPFQGPSYSGSDESKNKYDALLDLNELIEKYNDYISFTKIIDSYLRCSCYLSNEGNALDEDIDITIKTPKGYIVKAKDLPIPNYGIIDTINDSFNIIFTNEETHTIKKFTENPLVFNAHSPNPIRLPSNPLTGKTYEEEYNEFKEDYESNIEDYFVYNYFTDSTSDILTFNVYELKHNSKMFFPTHLLFTSKPEYIELEIRSKHSPEVITSKINFD